MRSLGPGFIDGFAAGAGNYRPAAPSSLTACGFLAEHLHRLEGLLVVRENRVGHFSWRSGAREPLRVELQGRFSLAQTLQDERSPSRQVLFLIGLSLSAGRSVKAHPPLIVHADAVLSMSTRQGGQGQDMPSKGARCQSLEATIPCDELAVCQNGETKVAPVVDRAVKL